MFAFNIGKSPRNSSFSIGGYNDDYFNAEKLTWHDITRDHHWMIEMTSAKLGDLVIPTKATELVVDTGTSYFLVHTSISAGIIIIGDFSYFASYFASKMRCYLEGRSKLITCECT